MKTKICKNCGNEFEINKNNRRNVFCSHSCAGIFNNKDRLPLTEIEKKNISKGLKKYWSENPNTFPSGDKHSKSVGEGTKGKYNNNIESILDVSKRTASKILKRMNMGCSICGWKESTCDIHHINGKKIENCNNHKNLTYLCPNHHRMAHTGKINKNDLISLDTYLPENWKDYYYG